MALAPRIEIRQSQTLAMTPQLQQAIRLLRMSNLEIAEFVAKEAERNPLIEVAARPPAPRPIPRLPGRATTDWDAALDRAAAPVSLAEHLHAQIGAERVDAGTAEAARLIAEELEDDGYLRAPLDEVAARHRLPSGTLLRGLALVQRCDPPGVGARSLGECLALQLRERNRLDPAMQALLDNLPLVARGRTGELAGICGVDAEDVADMLAELRALDPKPGLRFASALSPSVVPDVFVTRGPDGGFVVELNTETLPRVLVNNRYAAELGGGAGGGEEVRRFVSEMRASASWLTRSLEQRARSILKVAGEMVRHQQGFFEHGPAQLRPLTQRAVADRLGLHESTVSRVTAGKFLACGRGCFELRALFSVAIQSAGGGEAVSARAVQDRIRGLIAGEPPGRPVSDDGLVALLGAEGIEIARRTVAKYREGMGIPSSVERRRRGTAVAGFGPVTGPGRAAAHPAGRAARG